MVDLQKSSNFAPAFRGPVPESIKFNIKYLKQKTMIIVPVKEGENIEKALKKFKRKAPEDGARCLCTAASYKRGIKKFPKIW